MTLYENGKRINTVINVASYDNLKEEPQQRIKDLLQGAINSASNLREDASFTTSEMVGKNHADWSKNPLDEMRKYRFKEYRKKYSKEEAEIKAHAQAGRDVGRLVKKILIDSAIDYEIKGTGFGKRNNSRAYSIKKKEQ